MIGSLAWPVVLAVLAFSFRNHVTAVLPRLTKAKAFGGELEFGQALDKAERLAPPSLEDSKSELLIQGNTKSVEEIHSEDSPNIDEQNTPSGGLKFRLNTRADLPPEYRVISAWKFLFSEISRAALKKGLPVRGFLSHHEIRNIGPAIGLSPDRIQQVNELRELRNRAANEPDGTITITDALRYEDLVLSLLVLIESGHQQGDASA
jgi:hypothetical protein